MLQNILRENKETVEAGKTMRKAKAGNALRVVSIQNAEGEEVSFDESNVVNGVDTMQVKNTINVSFNADGSIKAMTVIATLAEGATCPKAAIEALGAKVTTEVGDIVIIETPAEGLEAIAEMSEFVNVEADYILHINNNVVRTSTSEVYTTGEKTYTELPQYFTGKDVVVGIIDQGIDFNHAAFRTATGETRIKEAMIYKGSTSTIYSTASEIEALTTGYTLSSHGTHTSATAAGSNVNNHQGMAPEADLVLCDLGSSLANSYIIAAAKEICSYAEKVNKPAVISVSLGTTTGLRNGSNAVAKAFNELTSGGTAAGRVIAVSSGNNADMNLGITKVLGADAKVKTVIKSNYTTTLSDGTVCASYPYGVQAYVYSNNTTKFTVELKVVDTTTGELYTISQKPIYNLTTGAQVSTTTKYTASLNSANNITIATASTTKAMYFKDPNLALAVVVTGEEGQKINIVEQKCANGYGNLIGENANSALAGFADGTPDLSINTMACTDGVISVGAYADRKNFLSINGNSYTSPKYTTDAVAYYSSYGTDDNGINRPDVVAPGVFVVSAYNLYDTSYFTNMQVTEGEERDITDYTTVTMGSYSRVNAYGQMSGTSMSCPVVAGIIALWLEADPTLSVADVRNILRETSLNDKYTTIAENIPSGNLVQAGFGKIDALRGIKYIKDLQLDEEVTIASVGMQAFSSDKALDFSAADAPTAYAATAFDNGKITFTRVEGKVPANTGLLLVGKGGTYNVPVAAEGTALATNYLTGTADAAVTLQNAAEAYVLTSNRGMIGFYKNTANFTVAQGSAYLNVETTTAKQAVAFDNSLVNAINNNDEIVLDDVIIANLTISDDTNAEATAINVVNNDNVTADAPRYNTAGQRVSSNHKGITIANGKTYIVK